ncbi:uncharacterized protein MYCFIDRAFT_173824 [Pseudocercospora fijiensis CIRAD86]|uniref:Uncharacterized protein n=1 Tax=Pseudocercospora fijiensis (strain CIRAD86) TaxID=383855 RepID=M3B6G8_PSEFD|nr:uncharacterized protein MYCFIDRAFT_173824 [Pseudocercospora fijiensis CIRAD86]EME84933.1 hypothetical protein MYCFIDRAFT_173824 [Pseudocercospora fijiensis CIRAD86]
MHAIRGITCMMPEAETAHFIFRLPFTSSLKAPRRHRCIFCLNICCATRTDAHRDPLTIVAESFALLRFRFEACASQDAAYPVKVGGALISRTFVVSKGPTILGKRIHARCCERAQVLAEYVKAILQRRIAVADDVWRCTLKKKWILTSMLIPVALCNADDLHGPDSDPPLLQEGEIRSGTLPTIQATGEFSPASSARRWLKMSCIRVVLVQILVLKAAGYQSLVTRSSPESQRPEEC